MKAPILPFDIDNFIQKHDLEKTPFRMENLERLSAAPQLLERIFYLGIPHGSADFGLKINNEAWLFQRLADIEEGHALSWQALVLPFSTLASRVVLFPEQGYENDCPALVTFSLDKETPATIKEFLSQLPAGVRSSRTLQLGKLQAHHPGIDGGLFSLSQDLYILPEEGGFGLDILLGRHFRPELLRQAAHLTEAKKLEGKLSAKVPRKSRKL